MGRQRSQGRRGVGVFGRGLSVGEMKVHNKVTCTENGSIVGGKMSRMMRS